jgi:DeoR family transcriptional regulator, fructose operon transcriptional repressor
MKPLGLSGNNQSHSHHANLHPVPADFTIESALPAKRHLDLLHLIQNRGQMTVQELSAHFQVSNDTIRRDLDFLAAQGRLTRTYGGAVANENGLHADSTFVQRMSTRNPAKKRIARAASRLIEIGETLLVNGGSTTALFASEIEHQNVTIVTNNLALASAMPPDRAVYLLGGRYYHDVQITIGPLFLSGVQISVDSAIISVGGISIRGGLSAPILEEALLTSSMIAAARRTIVVADATKFGQRSFAHICPFANIDILVTDRDPPCDLAEALANAGVEVIIAREA